ncbi:hypothetical protein [Rathayibacter soli]|uniref:hypothetical protein n=1 Tax=Rathayibacter soli TaxID=3144168 RepID=UPI0027E4C125|nr:hypothetical protein [Glaciibacter superstes]
MRTTLDIDDSVLSAARALARDGKISIGEAVSRLALRGLAPRDNAFGASPSGFPIFRPDSDAAAITLDLVNEHRDGD